MCGLAEALYLLIWDQLLNFLTNNGVYKTGSVEIDLTTRRLCVSAYHLLGHLLGHVFVELKEELDGVVVLVLPVELLGVVHA